MRNALPLLSALALLAAFAPAPARAWSLFGSSAEAKLLERADAAYAAAEKAAGAGNLMEELESLYSARSAYQRLSDEYPDYRADHVSQRLDAAAMLISAVSASLESGEGAIPDPAAADARAAEPGAPMAPAAAAPPPDAPAFRTPIPVLVQTDDGKPRPADAEPPPPAPARDEDPSISAAIPNPFFREPAAGPDAGAAPAPAATEGGASATVEVTLREAAPPAAVPPETDLRNARVFLDMVREAQATDAVLLIEDRLAEEGEAASLRLRLMYARALVQCRNYRRASDVLAELPKEAESDPAARTLRAATAVGLGNLDEAVLQLSLLLGEHPEYADAYVDLAYVYVLLDPAGNRDAAIANYKAGLEHGARRDPDLERALAVRVGR